MFCANVCQYISKSNMQMHHLHCQSNAATEFQLHIPHTKLNTLSYHFSKRHTIRQEQDVDENI